MSHKRKKIAILFHEKDRHNVHKYVISTLAENWRQDGLDVVFLFGVKEFVPADLVIVHVDLSVVPDDYLDFARRYPIAVNGQVKDIRKSTFSHHLVTPDDPYAGKVIVKSDLNHAGRPELSLNRSFLLARKVNRFLLRKMHRLGSRILPDLPPLIETPLDYRIYDDVKSVPASCFSSPNMIVEKFLPEKNNGLYHVRNCSFLGDRMTWIRLASKYPIVNFGTRVSMEIIEPDPEIMEIRKKLKFDYGKFDYVVHGGKVTLLDANKTTGISRRKGSSTPPQLKELSIYRAAGIYAYLV